jgi:hypothetical protein
MRMRWRPILCLWGLTLFGLLTYGSLPRSDRNELRHHHRYFWWGSVRLDSDPLGVVKPCSPELEESCDFDPQYIWTNPGWIEIALTLTAFPALILATTVAHGLSHLGVSEVLSFIPAMSLGTLAWFYAVGWLLDRWRFKRSLRRASIVPG